MQSKNAIYAGLCGATGSLFGKFISYPFDMIPTPYSWISRIICVIIMLSFNTLNMKFFVNSLQETSSSLTATVTSFGSNFFFSFVFGMLIFNESVSITSIIGILFILYGIHFLCDDKSENKIK